MYPPSSIFLISTDLSAISLSTVNCSLSDVNKFTLASLSAMLVVTVQGGFNREMKANKEIKTKRSQISHIY